MWATVHASSRCCQRCWSTDRPQATQFGPEYERSKHPATRSTPPTRWVPRFPAAVAVPRFPERTQPEHFAIQPGAVRELLRHRRCAPRATPSTNLAAAAHRLVNRHSKPRRTPSFAFGDAQFPFVNQSGQHKQRNRKTFGCNIVNYVVQRFLLKKRERDRCTKRREGFFGKRVHIAAQQRDSGGGRLLWGFRTAAASAFGGVTTTGAGGTTLDTGSGDR